MSDDEEEIEDKQVGDYILNNELGSGGFGKVVLGTHIPTGEKVAIKIMDKEQILSDELNKERVLNEISILKIVRHNNIIKLYEVMETPQKIYLIMEYCDNGEMFDYIVSKQHLTEEQACVFFQEIIDALTYLHSQKIVHRDVKPENILLQTFGNTLTTKLIDFGISRTYTSDKLITTPCGTASYAPPEMHKGEEYYGLLSDVWSAGVLLYAMVFGYLPFCEEDEEVNIDNIIKGNYEIPEEASPDLQDLIKHIMDIDPLTRYDLDQIKKHPWYNLVSPPKSYPGLIIGYHKIPIDERILKVCEEYGFNKDEVEKSVKENKYDNKSSIYYIILAKMKREGYESISDLFSQEYINYINDKNNIIEKKEEDEKKEEKDNKENINKDDIKQKGLDLLNDVLKNETDENEKEQKSNNNLEQITSNKNQKTINNELKDEISVSSESSKNIIEKEKEKENEQNKENKNELNNELYSNKSSKNNSTKSLNNEENKEDKQKKEEIIITLDEKINKENIIEKKEEENNNKPITLEVKKDEEIKINKNEETNPIVTEIVLEEKRYNINTPPIPKEIPEIKIKLETKPVEENKEKEEIIQITPIENQEENKHSVISLTEKNEQEKENKDINISIPIKEKHEIKRNNKKEEQQMRKTMEPKHSFYINMNTKKILMQELDENEYATENMNPNKLNSSFTQKLTDSLKENVFKMRNPKMIIPNKAKEINNALKEIKQNKKGKNVKKKEKIKNNNKIKKIVMEPLFKSNKKNEHTIIHNRNASAMNPERRKNNKINNNNDKINNNKNKVNKNASSSMEKNNKNHPLNKNIDLNNNIKKVKIGIKVKDKDKEKINKDNSVTKRKNHNHKIKKYDKFINKNSMTIKKNEINSLSSALLTVSNSKHSRIKSSFNSTNKKIDLKTPSKNLNKINFEPMYKKINSSSISKFNNKNNNLSQTGNLNKAIQLSEVKESKKITKFSYKKNIRLNFKNIDQEDFDNGNKTSFGHHKVKSNENLSLKKYNNNTDEKRKVVHKKSNSIEANTNSKTNKYINSYQNQFKNSYKYTPLIFMDKNQNKVKKFINLTSYDGPIKTDISSNNIKGNQKFWKKKQEEQILKECYYKGPIDLKNIYFGTSSEEIQEILIGILIKNRIKFWKMNAFRFYCKKNGESFVIRIHILSNKIKSNNINLNKSNEEIKVSEFEINKKNENDEIKINNGENNVDKYMLFYICVLSKDNNNKTQARQINKIINKKFNEIFKK